VNGVNCWAPGPYGDLYDTGIAAVEVEAVRGQNQYRTGHALPARQAYGTDRLPSAACQPPPSDAEGRAPMCRRVPLGCGATNGDPHLTTFDGVHYDFQAAGEFVLTEDDRGGFQIQVRQEPLSGSTLVAVTTAAAMDVGGTTVAFGVGGTVLIGGAAVADPTTALPGGGRVAVEAGRHGPRFAVTWPDGSQAQVNQIGSYGLLVVVQPAPDRMGHLRGLLGNFDGDRTNDIASRSGAIVPAPPDVNALYPGFADSWRITQARSLFSYERGASTGTYIDRPFPTRATSIADIQNVPGARAACRIAGVAGGPGLDDCVQDVGLTGSTAFADAIAAASP
jgi:hypothetical protein